MCVSICINDVNGLRLHFSPSYSAGGWPGHGARRHLQAALQSGDQAEGQSAEGRREGPRQGTFKYDTNRCLSLQRSIEHPPNSDFRNKLYSHRLSLTPRSQWSPVATAVFQYYPEIRINEALMESLTREQREAFVNACPGRKEEDWVRLGGKRKLFRIGNNGQVEVTDPEVYAYDGECIKAAEEMGFPGLVDIRPRLDRFIFRVEATGALPAAVIVQTAIRWLEQKTTELHLGVTEAERKLVVQEAQME